MTNENYRATGVLVLHAVTPVIQAVFGGYNLGAFDSKSAGVPKPHNVCIAKLSQADGPIWGDVLKELLELARSLPIDSEDVVQANDGGLLRRLVKHFASDSEDAAVSADVVLQLLEQSDPAEEANLPSLFMVASSLDDGHALEGIIFEGAWYGSELELGAYSGHGLYISERVCVDRCSARAVQLGVELDSAIAEGQFEIAAKVLADEVRGLLAMITDVDIREMIDDELMGLLWTDAAVVNDEPSLGDDSDASRLLM